MKSDNDKPTGFAHCVFGHCSDMGYSTIFKSAEIDNSAIRNLREDVRILQSGSHREQFGSLPIALLLGQVGPYSWSCFFRWVLPPDVKDSFGRGGLLYVHGILAIDSSASSFARAIIDVLYHYNPGVAFSEQSSHTSLGAWKCVLDVRQRFIAGEGEGVVTEILTSMKTRHRFLRGLRAHLVNESLVGDLKPIKVGKPYGVVLSGLKKAIRTAMKVHFDEPRQEPKNYLREGSTKSGTNEHMKESLVERKSLGRASRWILLLIAFSVIAMLVWWVIG